MAGNKLRLLTIPFEKINMTEPASRTPFVKETDAAYGFTVNGEMVWIPKSQIKDFEYDDVIKADYPCMRFWCPDWLIEAKSLEIFVDTSYEPSLFE